MKIFEQLLQGENGSHILPFLWMKGEDMMTIREELDKIEACGIREICLESRPHPQYCGPLWWETMDYLLPEVKRRGMKVWILDDDKFPTGHANGGFERHPELKKVYLAERHMDILGPCRNSAVLVENFLGKDGRLLGILACPKPDSETLAVSAQGVLDLTAGYRDGFVFFDLPEGAYRLFILFTTQKGGGRDNYMNLIDSRSVRVLIDEVYEKHYEHYAAYFGNTIAGFFSDEPELGNINGYPFDAGLGRRDVRLPWSGELEKELREEWGKAFLEELPALWYEMGEKTGRVRSQYMEHVTDLVYRCFSGQLGAWCEEHQVEYIGHIIEDDNAHTRLACSIGHYFKEMKGQHMAGVDVVHHQIVPGFTGKVHQWIAGDCDGEFFHFGLAKLASSAAHLDAKKKNRALCEIFGNYGWGEGVSLMKWLTNHMLVRGINVFTPHAFSMIYPDRDCPPHFYARGNNPQFPAFSQLMKYMQRASQLLSVGRPVAEAAVLYHAENEWSGRPYQLFQKPMRELMEQQLDCDVIPAGVLTQKTARVEDGCLVIGEMRYPCLVLPGAACEKREAAEFIAEAARQGLPVFAVGETASLDTRMNPLPEAFREAVREVLLADLAEEVRKAACPKLLCGPMTETERKNLRVTGRENDEGRIYMFFNESVHQTIRTEVVFQKKTGRAGENAAALAWYPAVTWYDPWTNRSRTFSLPDGRMPLVLEPQQSLFCVLEDDVTAGGTLPTIMSRNELDVRWQVSRADELHYGQFEPMLVLEPGEELPSLNSPRFSPGFTGYYRYETEFVCEKEEGCDYSLRLPDGGDAVQVFVNGVDLGYAAGFPVEFDITDALKSGANTLRMEFSTTLVWKRRDGASTHLQLFGTGLLAKPVVLAWKRSF